MSSVSPVQVIRAYQEINQFIRQQILHPDSGAFKGGWKTMGTSRYGLLVVIFLLLLGIDSARAQWRGEHQLDPFAGYASDLSMEVSGNNLYVMFHSFNNPVWTAYLAVSNDGGRSAWTRPW